MSEQNGSTNANGAPAEAGTTNRLKAKAKPPTGDWLDELDNLARKVADRASVGFKREHETAGVVRMKVKGFPESFTTEGVATEARMSGATYTRPVEVNGKQGTGTAAYTGAAAQSFARKFLDG